MKIEIEEYKGQTINYDDDADKFVCEITIEDNFKTSKRGSLKDLRKEIDQFIKENLGFKPFKALVKSEYETGNFSEIEVKAIRIDKKFIVKMDWRDQQYGKKEAARLMKYDYDLVKEQKQIEDDYAKAGETRKQKLKDLNQRLVPIDLSKYELS